MNDSILNLSQSPQKIYVEINKQIGEGENSDIYDGILKFQDSPDEKIVEIKFLKNQIDKRSSSLESAILNKLDHPNIIKHIYSDSEFSVYPLFGNRDLLRHMMKVKPKQTKHLQSIAHYLFLQLLDTLFYLRSQRIFHRDIKLDNFRLDDDFNLILSDFDFSYECQQKEESVNQGIGTRNYMAPENFEKEACKIDGFQADNFSAGVVLFSIYMGLAPFSQQASIRDIYYLYFLQSQQDYWVHYQQKQGEVIQEDFQELIEGMMESNPSQRFSLEQIQSHNWVCQDPISTINFQSIMREISGK